MNASKERPPHRLSRGPGRLSVAVLLSSISLWIVFLACDGSRGGWDFAALMEAYPSIGELEGHRLGDMLPFPVFEGDRVVLLACRYPPGQTIRVAGSGSDWPEDWGRAAVAALDRGEYGIDLAWVSRDAGFSSRSEAEIRVFSMDAEEESGPRGAADTLNECDVSLAGREKRDYRGVLTGAEIRIRPTYRDGVDDPRAATAEEWVGALMHEIGHALGFAGHPQTGKSILYREPGRLRAAGRLALAGEPWHDETLEALYRIRPGQRLGSRSLSAEAVSTLLAIREVVERDSLGAERRAEVRSSVGDWEARVQWRLSDGSRLSVRLKHWRDELRSNSEITLVPDSATQRRLARSLDERMSLVDGGF